MKKSLRDEIISELLYDYKIKYANKKLYPNEMVSIVYSETFLNDMVLDYQKNTELQNILVFKNITKLGWKNIDMDCEPEVMQKFVKMLDAKSYKGRTVVLKNGKKLDTDTLVSFITPFNKYMKTKIENYKEGIIGRTYIFNELKNKNSNISNDEVVKLFNLLAKINHTIGNFILIPEHKNTSRYKDKYNNKQIEDDIQMSVDYFKKDEEYREIFCEMDEELKVLSFNNLLNYTKNKTDNLSYPEKEYKKYLENVINLILIRGLHMLKIYYDDEEHKFECDKLINEIIKSGYECILKDL